MNTIISSTKNGKMYTLSYVDSMCTHNLIRYNFHVWTIFVVFPKNSHAWNFLHGYLLGIFFILQTPCTYLYAVFSLQILSNTCRSLYCLIIAIAIAIAIATTIIIAIAIAKAMIVLKWISMFTWGYVNEHRTCLC